MLRFVNSIAMVVVLAGCAGPSPQEVFDAAKKDFDREQAQLDSLLPAYTAAKQTALTNVTRELAGATTDEALAGTLGQLDSMSKALQDNANAADIKPGGFEAIDKLAAKQEETLKQLNTITSAAGKASEVQKNIQTPGTPEAKRYEEVLASMPEAQAYQRQQARLDSAKQKLAAAEAKLPK